MSNLGVLKMIFKTLNSRLPASHAPATVKQWPLGWTSREAARTVVRTTQGEKNQRPFPGAYGLLAGFRPR
jgi:hypothetical protein